MILISLSCTRNPTSSDSNSFTVSGYIYCNNLPLKNAKVSIDDIINLSTQTNIEGFFEIDDVSKGKHELTVIKTFDIGSNNLKTFSLEVNDDLNFDSLKFPKPVYIYDPIDISSNSVTLKWSSTDAIDFTEYKLYRHTNSGIDENTGELIHISTAVNDTLYIDQQFKSSTENFYRIYLMNNDGKLGSSNIVSCKFLKESFSITGNVYMKNNPVENAVVSIDDELNSSSYTNSNGFFEIDNIKKGTYELKINKVFENGSNISKTSTIELNDEDIYLEFLKLPKPVNLYDPEDVMSRSAIIKWSSTDATDFREYKLYRHTTSGLDENSGELIHVSTSILDTSFFDQSLSELAEYYYRVYVMNEYGKLGGSNIVSCKTSNMNLIKNGDFEIIQNDLPIHWTFNDDVFKLVKSEQSQSGEYHIYGDAKEYVCGLGWGSVEQRIPYTELIPGEQYILSFWALIEALPGNSTISIEFNPTQESVLYWAKNGSTSSNWELYEIEFTARQNISSDYFVRIEVCVHIPYNGEPWKVRIDNMKLERIP